MKKLLSCVLGAMLVFMGTVSAQVSINNLPNATLPLSGSELIILNQGTPPASKKTTVSSVIANAPPITATYLLQSANAGVPNSRTLVGTANEILLADGGPLGNLVLSTPQPIAIASSPTFAGLTLSSPLTGANGGTGNGFFAVSGPAASLKTFTFPNASATVLTSNAAVTVAQGGTGVGTLTAHGVLLGEGTSNVSAVAAMAADTLLQGQGAAADPAAVSVNNCGSANTALSYSTGTHTFGCQTITTGAVPGGADTQVQYNSTGSFAGSADFAWNQGTVTLNVGGSANGVITPATVSGAGKAISIVGGLGTTNGGAATLIGRNGVAGNNNGGDTTMSAGTATGSGTAGNVSINAGNSPSGTKGTISFGTNGTSNRVVIPAIGGLTVNAPDSGTALNITHAAAAPLGILDSGSSIGTIATQTANGNTTGDAEWQLQNGNGDKLSAGICGTTCGLAPLLTGGPASGEQASIATLQTVPLSIGTNATERIRIGGAGNVTVNTPASGVTLGIGSAVTPTVVGSTVLTGNTAANAYLELTAPATFGTGLILGSNGSQNTGNILLQPGGGTPFLQIGIAPATGYLSLLTQSAERMRIAAAGNVTINSPSSGTALTINSVAAGTGLAISVASAGADYVQINSTTSSFVGYSQSVNTGHVFSTRASSAGLFLSDATAGTNPINFNNSGAVSLPQLSSTSAAQTGTVCWSSTGGLLTVDTTVACLASTQRVKQEVTSLNSGLGDVMKMRPISYTLKPEFDPFHSGRQVGLIAEEVQKIDPRLIALDEEGKPRGVRYMQMTAVLVKAIQQQQMEIYSLYALLLGSFLFTYLRTR